LESADAMLAELRARVDAAHALEDEGWELGVSQFMGPMIRAHGQLGSLEQALESAKRCGVPAGTAVEGAQPPPARDQKPLAFGGGFVDGPLFGSGNTEEILVRDPYGRESLHPSRDEALRIVRVVIGDYAQRVGQLYPDEAELVDGVADKANAVT